jgi:glycogen debranching enzyme
MEGSVQIDNSWYIPATSSRADDRTKVLKSGNSFGVFSRHGEISWVGFGEQGFYFRGTRHLSFWHIKLAEREPMLLNSMVRLDNSRLVVDQTTPDIFRDEALWLPKGSLHLHRELIAHESSLSEHLKIVNYHDQRHRFYLEYQFDADFSDIFEVRGVERARRGKQKEPILEQNAVILTYEGLDGVIRRTRIGFNRRPDQLINDKAKFWIDLAPGDSYELESLITCVNGEDHFHLLDHSKAIEAKNREIEADRASRASVWSDNVQFNEWLNRSAADLQILTTETAYGPYPYAGIPWFSTPFGRDGLITALQTLWVQPELARGVLAFLAATQAESDNLEIEAEPGKILHEMREGEMPALDEVPFRRYYGTVDATPLFVVLAGRYFQRTGDMAFIRELWPNIEKALKWVTTKLEQDGFLSYRQHVAGGLVQQGWKDSNDSIFHRDGNDAIPPIALCEVQGYAWDALKCGAELADRLELAVDLAERFEFENKAHYWRTVADRLQEDFEAAFWLDDLDIYAIALDGTGKPCAVRSSNPGHLLYNGIVKPERAERLVRQLTGEDAFNGWGLRTIFAGEARYNPMSYHNGSVWPHDTALAAAGMVRYGFVDEALKFVEGMFNASVFLDQHRLPELFCGFNRMQGQGPILYPVACAPQAWASGAIFMLIEAMLGISFESARPRLRLHHPRLPSYLDWLRIRDLRYGTATIDLTVRRHGNDIAVSVERRNGDIGLVAVL